MQTFLPFPDFGTTGTVLDYRRLGKQRVEVIQILNALFDPTKGWKNHPATKMWRGHENTLVTYGLEICASWIDRGYKDTCYDKIKIFWNKNPNSTIPEWLGNEDFHRSHRRALLFKNQQHYEPYFPNEVPELNYIWPVK